MSTDAPANTPTAPTPPEPTEATASASPAGGSAAAPSSSTAEAAAKSERSRRLKDLSTERVRKWREKKKAEKAAAEAQTAQQEGPKAPEKKKPEAEAEQSDRELEESLGMFFGGVVFPVLSLVARLFRLGSIGELTRADESELGRAFLPWGRKFKALAFTATWATAPARLIRKVRERFIAAPRPGPRAVETETAATAEKPQQQPQQKPADVIRMSAVQALQERKS